MTMKRINEDELPIDQQPVKKIKIKIKENGSLGTASRYYDVKTVIPEQTGHEQQILVHRNGIYVIAISPSHPIVTKGVKSVNFDMQTKNFLHSRVKGKRNKGGLQIRPETYICNLIAKDETLYQIPSTIPGIVVQANSRLIEDPELVVTHPSSKGYIAIIKPTKAFLEKAKLEEEEKASGKRIDECAGVLPLPQQQQQQMAKAKAEEEGDRT
mmetsp:Transcript_20966/g.31610  ORF Transcript_20966/g.31610 Transcript_20966/m.31610 type:complete len:212 (+) Transcript_20966:12-647(+)